MAFPHVRIKLPDTVLARLHSTVRGTRPGFGNHADPYQDTASPFTTPGERAYYLANTIEQIDVMHYLRDGKRVEATDRRDISRAIRFPFGEPTDEEKLYVLAVRENVADFLARSSRPQERAAAVPYLIAAARPMNIPRSGGVQSEITPLHAWLNERIVDLANDPHPWVRASLLTLARQTLTDAWNAPVLALAHDPHPIVRGSFWAHMQVLHRLQTSQAQQASRTHPHSAEKRMKYLLANHGLMDVLNEDRDNPWLMMVLRQQPHPLGDHLRVEPLALSPNVGHRRAAATHINRAPDLAAKLAQDSSSCVRVAVARRQPVLLGHLLVHDPNPVVRAALAAASPGQENEHALASDPVQQVRHTLARHSQHAAVIARLSEDASEAVRMEARQRFLVGLTA
jgi:hypothetical protein